jgi:hypothetical protein
VASGKTVVPESCQARDQEKWIPVFRPIARQYVIFDHVSVQIDAI